MQTAAILLSGGMDSGVLLAWARQRYGRLAALSFDYGSKHGVKEQAMAERRAAAYDAEYVRVQLPFINELFVSSLLKSGAAIPDGPYGENNMSSTVVPFRNGIMLSIAAGYAESHGLDCLLIASHAGDHPVYPDCRPEFDGAMCAAIKLGTTTGVNLLAPFAHLSKAEIAATGRALNFDFTATWSCYKGLDKHCGTCATCLERKQALDHAAELDPTEYLK